MRDSERYFATDPMGVQAAGDPLPDLALAYYQQRGMDAHHMKDGRAVCPAQDMQMNCKEFAIEDD